MPFNLIPSECVMSLYTTFVDKHLLTQWASRAVRKHAVFTLGASSNLGDSTYTQLVAGILALLQAARLITTYFGDELRQVFSMNWKTKTISRRWKQTARKSPWPVSMLQKPIQTGWHPLIEHCVSMRMARKMSVRRCLRLFDFYKVWERTSNEMTRKLIQLLIIHISAAQTTP